MAKPSFRSRSSTSQSHSHAVSQSRGSRISLTSSGESDSDFDDYFLETPVKSRFTSGNFLKASQIIRSIKNPTREDRRPVFWSDEERILTYELTVAVLKHSAFLKDALDKSNFYARYPRLQEFGQEEVLVILYDLIERDFRITQDDSPLPDAFSKLQTAVLASKTKLMAHIAKLRIKHEATSLENLLPSNIKNRHCIDRNPLYFWINLKKISVEKVASILKSHKMTETIFEDDTLIQEHLFNASQLHPDLVRLHSNKTSIVQSMNIFRDGLIVVQDRSACIPVYILVKSLYFKEAINHRGAGMEHLNPFPNGIPHMMNQPDPQQGAEEWYQDILDGYGKQFVKPECVVVTHCGSGRTAAHLAMLLAEAVPRYLSRSKDMSTSGRDLAKAIKGKFIFRPPLTVVVFGTPRDKQEETSRYIKRTLGVVNMRLYPDTFLSVNPKDARIKGCGAILVNPPSSGSALKDPAAYICSEGGDEQVLSQYSQFMLSAGMQDDNGNSIQYSPNQAKYLSHALSIPNVKLVMYTTCSNLACENGEVVRYCLNEAIRKEEMRKCQLYASIAMQSQSKPYREVNFDVVNLEQLMDGYDTEACLEGEYVNMQPSSACSGVFVALIRRRDRQVTMAKTAVKQFVASQIRVWSEEEMDEDSELDEILSLQASVTPSASNIPAGITVDELSGYLIRKLNLDSPNFTSNNEVSSNGTCSTIPLFPAQMKKKLSKRAIVKRVSTPTHSSLQRQTEKFYVPPANSNTSCPSSGVNTPRSGIRSPIMSLSARDSEKTPRSGSGGHRPGSGRSATSNNDNNEHRQQHHHHHHPCSHNSHNGHVCVCARHAKKFPEMIKNL